MTKAKLVIGLTGGIGSGKSAAAELFSKLGVTVIDADIAARKVVEPGTYALQEIISHFGDDILGNTLTSEPSLDRKKLRTLIFSNPEQRIWLNNLLHPLIRDWMDDKVAQSTSSYVIKVIPLLIESELQQQVDRILVIDVLEQTQIERATARDNSSSDEIEKIIQSQAKRKERLAMCHDVINNNSSLLDLENAVKKMHNKYLKIAENFDY